MIRSFSLFFLTIVVINAAELDTLLCIKVIDGDSFHALHSDGSKVTIRLYGIDCPERGQPYGDSAKQFLSGQIAHKKILIKQMDKDRYARVVAKVYMLNTEYSKKKSDLNILVLQNGYAWWYTRYAPNEHSYQTAMRSAQRKKRGLWRYKHSIAPWKWRKMSKNTRNKEKTRFHKIKR